MLQYAETLTSYAYGLVSKQFAASPKTSPQEDGTFLSHEGLLTVSSDSCSCSFFRTTNLPCRHILRLHTDSHMAVFTDTLAPQRWRRDFWYTSVATSADAPASVAMVQGSKRRNRILTETEKFREAKVITDELRYVTSQCGMTDFKHRISQLHCLLQSWKAGRDVYITGL